MSKVSVLVIVDRPDRALDPLLRDIAAQSTPPQEVVAVATTPGRWPERMADPGCRFYRHVISPPPGRYSLPIARNRAAAEATGEVLAYLDADCRLGKDYLERLLDGVSRTQGIVVGHAGESASVSPADDVAFRGRSFGIRSADFERLGGFATDLTGESAVDTAFAAVAHRTRLPLSRVSLGEAPAS